MVFWHMWIGGAWNTGPASREFLAFEARVNFLVAVEHRCILARVRSECSRLKSKGLALVWAPASGGSSHVGNAGVGVVRLRGAPVALPSFATAEFRRFF